MLAVWDGPPADTIVRGRDRELATLTGSLGDAAHGRGAAHVLVGRPGTGRTTLLESVAARAEGFQVLRVRGTVAESAVAFAGLHQLLRPLQHLVPRLPACQAAALARALSLRTRPDPDFAAVLNSATHGLLATAATTRPVLCCVDSTEDVDPESVAAVAFAARRLDHLGVVVLFATDHVAPPPHAESLAGLSALDLGPLSTSAAHRILRDRLGSLPYDLADSLVELARGNPSALVELTPVVTADRLSGRTGPPASLPLDSRLCRTIRRRLGALGPLAREMAVLASVDERLDRHTLARVYGGAGTAVPVRDALAQAEASGLVTVCGEAVRLPDTVLPCTVLAATDPAEQRRAHRLLADAADPVAERYRFVWHRAATGEQPARELVHELDAVADQARSQARHAEAAVAGERAAALSATTRARARRLVTAAGDHWAAGRPHRARTALRRAEPLAHGDLAADAGLLAGEIELRRGNPAVAAAGLIGTARRLVPTRRSLAATTLMLAGEASFVAGDDASYCATARDASRIRGVDELPATRVVLDHFAAMSATLSGDHNAAAEPLRRVVGLARTTRDPAAKTLASQAAFTLGEATESRSLAVQAVASARDRGHLAAVPWSMVYVAMAELLSGQLATATASALEGLHLAESLGQANSAVDHLTVLAMLAALQGDQRTAELRLASASSGSVERGLSRPSTLGAWAAACVDLSHDRPADALDRFRRMSIGRSRNCSPIKVLAVPHFVEAAVRCGEQDSARRALAVFERWATTTGGKAREALAHRCHALLAEHGERAEEHFTEAIRLHRDAGSPYDLASTQLLYAARLRRGRKPTRARDMLREAVQIFDELGATHWVDRAGRELRACGDPGRVPRGRDGGTAARKRAELSPQQERIARLVAEGATNREIAAILSISHRTVDHHLRNIFTKFDLRSRVELATLYR